MVNYHVTLLQNNRYIIMKILTLLESQILEIKLNKFKDLLKTKDKVKFFWIVWNCLHTFQLKIYTRVFLKFNIHQKIPKQPSNNFKEQKFIIILFYHFE